MRRSALPAAVMMNQSVVAESGRRSKECKSVGAKSWRGGFEHERCHSWSGCCIAVEILMRFPTLVIQAWEMLPSDSVEDAASFAAFYSIWVQIHGLPVDSIQAGIWVQNPWGEKRAAELMKVESSREAIDVPRARDEEGNGLRRGAERRTAQSRVDVEYDGEESKETKGCLSGVGLDSIPTWSSRISGIVYMHLCVPASS